MINLFNKILKRFNLQVVPKQEEPQQEYSLVEETVKFLDRYPKSSLTNDAISLIGVYVGDINFIKGKNGKTYYQDTRSEKYKYFCDYDMKNPSKEVLEHMIDETTFTKEQLEEELKDD
jgi:hypothetical protein